MRAVLKLFAVLVVILVAGWLGLWWYAQGRLESALTDGFTQAAANPTVKLSYDSLVRGTSPLRALVTVTNLRLSIQPTPDDAPVTVNVPSYGLEIDLLDPLVLHVNLPAAINVSAPKGDASLTFGSTSILSHLDQNALFNSAIYPIRSTEFAFTDVAVLASSGSLQVLHIDRFGGNASLDGGGLAEHIAIENIALSPLLTRIASIPFDGKITHFALDLTGAPASIVSLREWAQKLNAIPQSDKAARDKFAMTGLHDWAAAGGAGSLHINLVVGPSTLDASANGKFDANVQPAGTATVTANHLDAFSAAITAAYPQAQDSINLANAQLSQYLTTTPADGQVLTMHVAFAAKTGVTVNGTQVAPLPPIDWQTLENPPPPAGDSSTPPGR